MTNIVKKSLKQRETYSDEDDIPFIELAKGLQEKDRTDKSGNDDASAEDQKSVGEESSFNNIQKSHRLRHYFKLLQAYYESQRHQDVNSVYK